MKWTRKDLRIGRIPQSSDKFLTFSFGSLRSKDTFSVLSWSLKKLGKLSRYLIKARIQRNGLNISTLLVWFKHVQGFWEERGGLKCTAQVSLACRSRISPWKGPCCRRPKVTDPLLNLGVFPIGFKLWPNQPCVRNRGGNHANQRSHCVQTKSYTILHLNTWNIATSTEGTFLYYHLLQIRLGRGLGLVVVNHIPSHSVPLSTNVVASHGGTYASRGKAAGVALCCRRSGGMERMQRRLHSTVNNWMYIHPHVFSTLLKGNGRADIVSLAIEQERFGFESFRWKHYLLTFCCCFALILMWGDSDIGSFVPLWCLRYLLGWAGGGNMLCQADNGNVASWVRKGMGRESQECWKKWKISTHTVNTFSKDDFCALLWNEAHCHASCQTYEGICHLQDWDPFTFTHASPSWKPPMNKWMKSASWKGWDQMRPPFYAIEVPDPFCTRNLLQYVTINTYLCTQTLYVLIVCHQKNDCWPLKVTSFLASQDEKEGNNSWRIQNRSVRSVTTIRSFCFVIFVASGTRSHCLQGTALHEARLDVCVCASLETGNNWSLGPHLEACRNGHVDVAPSLQGEGIHRKRSCLVWGLFFGWRWKRWKRCWRTLARPDCCCSVASSGNVCKNPHRHNTHHTEGVFLRCEMIDERWGSCRCSWCQWESPLSGLNDQKVEQSSVHLGFQMCQVALAECPSAKSCPEVCLQLAKPEIFKDPWKNEDWTEYR